MDIISTKEFATSVLRNITDVSRLFFYLSSYMKHTIQDRTHPPDYYNAEYDIKPDHGTVRGS